jgi:hypothetical protein
MTRARIRLATVLVLAALAVSACAAGPNPDVAHTAGHAGFWLGLWHGFITPVTFVISLFTDHVNIYEVRNTGNWYDFGYVLGLTTSLGGSAGSGRAATRGRTYPARRRGR